MARIEIDFAYNDVTVQLISLYITKTLHDKNMNN